MSSTEDGLRALFLEKMVVLAETYRRRGLELMPLRPDPAAVTYFQGRRVRSMAPSDFESGGATSIEGFRAALAAHWEAERLPELAALAGDCAALAASLRAAESQPGEVSPFIYVMF